MFDFPWPTLLATAFIVLLAYSVFGLTGFGAAIVGIPLLAHFYPLRFAVPMMLVFDLCAGLMFGLRDRKQVSRTELLWLAPFVLMGMALGIVLLINVNERWLLMVLGAFVLVYAVRNLLKKNATQPISRRWALPAGVIGGSLTSMFGTGGPIYVLYLAGRITDVSVLRASLGVLIFSTALARLGLFTTSGFYNQPSLLPLAFALAPICFLGYWLGSRLHARLPAKRASQAVWLLLIGGGASLLWRSFWM
jgi:uncharacterized membrane protein YfcA